MTPTSHPCNLYEISVRNLYDNYVRLKDIDLALRAMKNNSLGYSKNRRILLSNGDTCPAEWDKNEEDEAIEIIKAWIAREV